MPLVRVGQVRIRLSLEGGELRCDVCGVAGEILGGVSVVAGTSVRTEIIAERHRAGEKDQEIAYDFGLKVPHVKAALRYELPSAACTS